jgi:membrane-bound inhibitor of C-type lysozyme
MSPAADRCRRALALPGRVALGLLLALPAAAQDAPEGLSRTYACKGGKLVKAVYINPHGGSSYAVVDFDDRLIAMKAGPTGSGVRYVSLDSAQALVWHTRGDEAFLARDADMSMLAEDCVARRE